MDVAWQDSIGSFLGWAGTDPTAFASSATADGGTLWSSPPDSPLFSGESVLWESRGDSPGDSHLAALGPNTTETDGSLASTWIADGTSGLLAGSSAMDGGLLWAGAGSDGSTSLAIGGGSGGLGSLSSLDLGGGGSQWQQFVDHFASQSTTWLSDVQQHLMWTGGSSQTPLAPPITPDSLHLASSAPAPTLPSLAPEQHLVWTDPSMATGLTAGPGLGNAAATTVPSAIGGPVDPLASTGPFAIGVTR